MTKLLLLGVMAVLVANANIIPALNVGSGGVTCGFDAGAGANVCTYNYTAQLHERSMLTATTTDFAEFFTIYDFNGYVDGSATGPGSDWVVAVDSPTGTPSKIAIGADDNAAIPNLTFTYTGAVNVPGGTTISGFSAKSYNGPSTITDVFTSQVTQGPGANAVGSMTQNTGYVNVPNPAAFPGDDVVVPEPMSMGLLGFGLVGLGLLRRLKK